MCHRLLPNRVNIGGEMLGNMLLKRCTFISPQGWPVGVTTVEIKENADIPCSRMTVVPAIAD
jgi:hypothetical protein